MLWLLASCADVPPGCTSVAGELSCASTPNHDRDGDGFDATAFGGEDCDDADPALTPEDADGDGYASCRGDCDDEDPRVGPRGVVPEVCDNLDNDCNGVVDVDDLGRSACEHTVVFPLPDRVALDLLFVVDPNPSFSFARGRLADAAETLLAPLVGTETHVAVVSTVPANGGQMAGPGTSWLDAEHTDLDTATSWFTTAADRSIPFERPTWGLLNATRAVDGVDLPSNTGFRRDSAALVIVFVSSEDDQSGYSPDQFVDWLQVSSHADPSAGVYGILPEESDLTCGVSQAAVIYGQVLDRTLPAAGDLTSVCSEDWATPLGGMALAEAPPYQIWLRLTEEPVPTTLAVDVSHDGVVETLDGTELEYDPFGNRVFVPRLVWSDLDAPPVVRYQVLPATTVTSTP